MDIRVLNTDFECVKVLDTFESEIWTDRYNEYGDFELYFAMDSDLLNYLVNDYYLQIAESEHTMIVESIKTKTDLEDGNKLIVEGRSLESILTRRIIWGQETFTGNMQTAIQKMLNDSIINPSIEDRRIANFVFQESTDPKITALTIDNQYTGDELYEIIRKLCGDNKVGFKIVLNDSNQFVFSLYAGADRSYEQSDNPYVIFSPNFDNIINSNFITATTSYKNVTYVAGEGEGADRKSVVVGSCAGLNRRELFTDARDISSKEQDGTELTEQEYMAKLEGRGSEQLGKNEISTAFEGEVDATNLFVYGEDFFVGDIVQIANEYGHEGAAYISELVITVAKDEQSVYPTFKTLSGEEDEGI